MAGGGFGGGQERGRDRGRAGRHAGGISMTETRKTVLVVAQDLTGGVGRLGSHHGRRLLLGELVGVLVGGHGASTE